MFWGILANALALSFAVLSWVGCLHVFGRPELPANYDILARIGRRPVMESYTAVTAPRGEVSGPRQLLERYGSMGAEGAAGLNRLLVRNYLKGFDDTALTRYVEGDFRVDAVRLLGEGDFVPEGFLVGATAMLLPEGSAEAVPYPVRIDLVFPGARGPIPFREGSMLRVSRSVDAAVLMRVEPGRGGVGSGLRLGLVSLACGERRTAEGGSFKVRPPEFVRLRGRFPGEGD